MLAPNSYHISCLLDQFATDAAATVIRATGHQMVSLCRSVCEEEKAQLLSPLMNTLYFPPCSGSVVSYLVYNIRFSVGRTE